MNALDHLDSLLRQAKAAGADAADAVSIGHAATSVNRRQGQTEALTRAEVLHLGLRVFVGRRSAIVSATALDPAAFSLLVERAVAMARIVPEDPLDGLAEAWAPPEDVDLDLVDHAEPTLEALIARAAVAEDAALTVPGVSQTGGTQASFTRSQIALVTSAGFAGMQARTTHWLMAKAVAGQGTAKERDYHATTAVHLGDLEAADQVGRLAGEKTVSRVNPRRPAASRLPVVFDPRMACSLPGHLASAINGGAIACGTSFLAGRLGTQVFARGIHIIDDPRRPRGLRSRRFDAEGVPTQRRSVIADGVLTSWFLDSRTARQLGLTSTGSAFRFAGAAPGPASTNLYLAAGPLSPADLMADIKEGLYVTELMGEDVNIITGGYRRTATGFMIRNGTLAEPVAMATIQGSLEDMFRTLTPANDLHFRHGIDAPTTRVDSMTLVGP